MICFQCKKQVISGVNVLQKNGVVLIPSTVNPKDYDNYCKAVDELLKIGYERTILCRDCETLK